MVDLRLPGSVTSVSLLFLLLSLPTSSLLRLRLPGEDKREAAGFDNRLPDELLVYYLVKGGRRVLIEACEEPCR